MINTILTIALMWFMTVIVTYFCTFLFLWVFTKWILEIPVNHRTDMKASCVAAFLVSLIVLVDMLEKSDTMKVIEFIK